MIRPITTRRVMASRFASQHIPFIDAVPDVRPLLWMKQARCLNEDPDTFFDRENAATSAHLRRLCASCPVIVECLEFALERDEKGWWGGMSKRQRNALLAARRASGKARSA